MDQVFEVNYVFFRFIVGGELFLRRFWFECYLKCRILMCRASKNNLLDWLIVGFIRVKLGSLFSLKFVF